jgi:hypothetical protein
LVALLFSAPALAQNVSSFLTPSETAPVDLTGYWVSIVSEDWIERMSPDSPPTGTGFRGGQAAEPIPASNPGEPCRVYGAAGSLRVPGRLHITWLDDSTLQIAMDAGTQTRVLHFDPAAAAPAQKTLQGYSIAKWNTGNAGRNTPQSRDGNFVPRPWGSLEVETTNMSGGYLLSSRSNYTDEAKLTEHFTYHSDFGTEYFTVTAVVDDGGSQLITSSTFKKEPNGSKFSPMGCEIVR